MPPRFFADVVVACACMYLPSEISVRLISDAWSMNVRSWLDTGWAVRLAARLALGALVLAPATAVPAIADMPQPAVARPTASPAPAATFFMEASPPYRC